MHFWSPFHAPFFKERIVRGGKSEPLFTGVALRFADAALWVHTMRGMRPARVNAANPSDGKLRNGQNGLIGKKRR